MNFPGISIEWTSIDEVVDVGFPVVDGDMQKAPEIPPEVWNTKPVDGDRAMAAVRAMCA